tara:strand:- start:673 stop:879 length:207 start_codon:yes stop_codon:yes gene_type:complete
MYVLIKQEAKGLKKELAGFHTSLKEISKLFVEQSKKNRLVEIYQLSSALKKEFNDSIQPVEVEEPEAE